MTSSARIDRWPEHLDPPTPEMWEERRRWFESVNNAEQESVRGYLVSEQACALTIDVELAFCAGAWLAVIVLAAAVVDAQLRETEVPGFSGNAERLINAAGAHPALHDLRRRRNALVHVPANRAAVTVQEQYEEQERLEAEARDAIRLMLDALYANPCI
jgi:hypothetical protein